MHLDRVCDLLQIQRSQMCDAMREEGVLLADDFTGDFQDGAGALV